MMKRILSFLLAFLMVVSIFPAPAYATDSTDVTITPTETPTEAATETPCPTCGTVGCTSEHLTWCPECKVDDCGKTHVFCEICQKNDCGQNHCATCGTIDCTKEHKECDKCGTMDCTADHTNWCAECKKDDCGVDHNAADPTEAPANEIAVIDDGENASPYHANIGRKAQFDLTYSQFPIVSDPAGITAGDVFGMDSAVSKDVIPADLIVKIADCYVNEAEDIYWYKIEAAEGYSLPAEFPAPAWVFQDNVSYSGGASLILLDEEPENTCGCCESCTGAEGCECECGECDFCEKEEETTKPEEPTVPSISDTVNGQTVTVNGTLPQGVDMNLSASRKESGVTNTIEYDIELALNGESYEPESAVSVTISGIDVVPGGFVKVTHFLEDLEAIKRGYGNGTVQIWTDSSIASSYPAAAAAAQEALGMADTVCVEQFYSTENEVSVGNGTISFAATSFSIYTVTYTGTDAGRAYAVYDDDNGTAQNSNGYSETHEITMDDSNGQTFMLTRGQKFYLDIGPTFFETGMTSYQWYLSESSIGSMDTSGFGTLAGNDTVLTVSTNAPLYKHYTITLVGYNLWGKEKDRRYINVYVVPEVQLIFYPNIPSGATSSNVTVPSSRKTVLGDGSTAVKYTRVQVSNPSGTVTGYTFIGWYTAATGGEKVSSGSYIFLDNDNAELVSGGYSDQYQEKLYAHWKANNYTVKFHANGGSGTMSDQSMTYDKAAALSANQFTRTGHVFLGWSKDANATAATYTDSQSVSNLTATDNDVVNLYAVWVDVMAIEDMRIGINESYYFTNYTYTVTADGVSTQSYHAYPNEPAVQNIRYMRPTDKSGSWQIVQNDTLAGSAHNYIDPAILNSDFFVRSYKADQNVWGVADPSGAKTRPFIKSTIPQQEIINIWLQSMADRTAATPNDDGTYNIDSWGSTYKTDVNWKNEVDKGADYEIIPYVIKLENNNAWRIDMVIAPKTHVTLSYNLNINTSAGYVLSGGSSIPSAQYRRGTTQNVLASPTAYNANIKVTKPGTTYVAKFLYWEDEQGNKYGTGQNTTIKMDSSKSLRAVWEYTDQTEGALHVEKEVTVPAGSGIIPDTQKEFTLNVELGTSGTYSYVKYSTSGIASSTGTFTGNNASFTLKSDEYVVISGIPKNTSYNVSETAPTGYTNKSEQIKGNIQPGNTMSAVIVNERNAYTIKWSVDGTVVETDNFVEHGSMPNYDGATPTKLTDQFIYEFTGWSPTLYAATKDETYVATFSQTANTHTLTGVIDENGTVSDPVTVPNGQPASLTFKSKHGYKLATWAVENGSSGTFASSPQEEWQYSTEQLTASYSVTVTTAPIEYSITYDLNDGELAAGATNPETYTIETETFTLNNPIRDGYEFMGWAETSVAEDVSQTVTIAQGTTGNKTYYATWKLAVADLTISISGNTSGQNYVFSVTNSKGDEVNRVVLYADKTSITIRELPVDAYTVTPVSGWAWRQNVSSADANAELPTQDTVTFVCSSNGLVKWLNGFNNDGKKGG